jgi:hypothetical protein
MQAYAQTQNQSAGASGGVRVIVLRFIEERIKDKVVAEGLELAGIDNPWVQTLAGFATGFVPSAIKAPKLGAVKGLDQLEREAQTVTRGGSMFKPNASVGEAISVPKMKAGAPAAPETAAPKPAAASVGPRTEMIGDNLFVLEKASAAEIAAHTAQGRQGDAEGARSARSREGLRHRFGRSRDRPCGEQRCVAGDGRSGRGERGARCCRRSPRDTPSA